MSVVKRMFGPKAAIAGTGLISGTPIKSPDPDMVLASYIRMLYVIGSLASLVQGQLRDLCAELEGHPDIFRHEVKRDIKEAMRKCDGMVRHIGSLADASGDYSDWLDITDTMEENVRVDMTKLYFTVDNAVHRRHHEPHRVATLMVIALNLAHQLETVVRDCQEVLHEISPRLWMTGSLDTSSTGIRSLLQEVNWRLVPVGVFMECKTDTSVRLGFDIVYKKMTDLGFLDERAADQALQHGVAFRKEDQVPGCNNGKVWNDYQDRVLRGGYGSDPDEELAAVLGRSVAAIRARARFLRLRKNQSIEERAMALVERRKKNNNNK